MLKRIKVRIWNLLLFAALVSWRIPPWRWTEAWNDIHEEHSAQIRKAIWAAKIEGRIREDSNGRLWSIDDE